MRANLARRMFLWPGHHPVWAFLVLTFAWTWFWWGIAALTGVGDGVSPFRMIGGLGPAIAAWVLSRSGRDATEPARVPRYRWTYAAAAAVAAGVFALYALRGGDLVPGGQPVLLNGAFLVVVVLLVAGLIAGGRSPDPGIRARMASLLEWRKPWWLWAAAFLIYPAILAMGGALAWALGAPVPLPAAATQPLTVWGPLFVTGVLMTGFFRGGPEELGWRGFMLPELQKQWSPLAASLLIAVVWSLWHLPLHVTGFYDGPVAVGMVVRTLRLIPLAILFTWLYNRSGGSLLLVVVLHAVHNNASSIAPTTYWSFVPGILVIGGLAVWDRMWRPLPNTVARSAGTIPHSPYQAKRRTGSDPSSTNPGSEPPD